MGKGNIGDYQGVCVFAEQRESKLNKVTLELLGKGRELADTLRVDLSTILIGYNIQDLCKELISYGADKIYLVDKPELANYQSDTYVSAMCKYVEEYKPEIILVGATSQGRDLAPKAAMRLTTGLTADCTDLEIDEKGMLLQTRPAFNGNIVATIVTPDHRPQMATIRPRAMKSLARNEKRSGYVIPLEYEPEPNDLRVKVLDIVKQLNVETNIEDAEVIVAGGRGLGSAEGFKLLKDLAQVLGGEIGATRDVVDSGWISHDYQIGQTGKTVRSRLYIACGISGAVQHVAGMRNSDIIVAINTDPNAAIFEIADYGIIADYNQAVPVLTKTFEKFKNA